MREHGTEGIACEALAGNDAIAILDLELDEELLQEGMARDVVRAVQQARKEAGLHVSDRIALYLDLPEAFQASVRRFQDYVTEQTLATEIRPLEETSEVSRSEAQLGGATVRIGVRRSGD